MAKKLDTIGWFIATLHQLIGHDAAERVCAPSGWRGNRADCLICAYEKNPTPERKQAVIDALAPRA